MNYQCDLYIMLPCIQKGDIIHDSNPKSDASKYIEELSDVSKYEFKSALHECINRDFLWDIKLVCKSDDRDKPEPMGHQDAFIVCTSYKESEHCVLTVVVIDNQVSTTHLLDQASRGELVVIVNDEDMLLSNFIALYGFELTGKMFFAPCVSKLPDYDEASYLISGEANNTNNSSRISSKTVEELLSKNHTQYTSYDAYMSECSVLYVLTEFSENYAERLEIECLLIFIMELVALKITVINYANNSIVSAISKKDATLKEILDISESFASSLPLWDIRHFRYFLAQEFANKLESAFNVIRYVDDYEKNRVFLEQLINIRKLIATEKETKVISLFATVLATIQAGPLLYSLLLYLLEGRTITINQAIAFSISSAVILVIFLLLFKRRTRKR